MDEGVDQAGVVCSEKNDCCGGLIVVCDHDDRKDSLCSVGIQDELNNIKSLLDCLYLLLHSEKYRDWNGKPHLIFLQQIGEKVDDLCEKVQRSSL
jgi:hypothetical protein